MEIMEKNYRMGKCCCHDDKKQSKTTLVGLCTMAVLYLPTEKNTSDVI